jgi:DNA repair protein RadD
MLRPYQQKAIDDLYAWFQSNSGHPCLELPTGAGKSHIVAALCKDAVQSWPDTRILMLTTQKELIEQNYEKLLQHWPNAPVGIYSASVGRRQLGNPITFAGVQSVRSKAERIGHIDLCLIDECHLINHKDTGSYRSLLAELWEINPDMRVVGLTASPYRLGHGLITDDPAIFDDIIKPVTIEELVLGGFLSPLRSKLTGVKYDLTGIHKRGGEYIESELMARLDTDEYNFAIAEEIMAIGQDRRSWLLFCTGVEHSRHMATILREMYGIAAEVVTGDTPKPERERILSDFKAGKIRALANCAVLTTGFDAPEIDLIAMLRPTMSPSLYVQMAGRGMRVAPGKTDCLVLDFAGVVQQHGPITAIQPPKKAGEGNGEPLQKSCENCWEIVHISAKACPSCGEPFPAPDPDEKDFSLRQDDIMGLDVEELEVTNWHWRKHTSRTSNKDMLAVTYYGALSDAPVTEYFPVAHEGYAGQKATRTIAKILESANAQVAPGLDMEGWASVFNAAKPPSLIAHKRDGKYRRVIERRWHDPET